MPTQKEIAAELENLGLAHLTIYEYVFGKRMDEVLKCVELLEDDESVEVYTELIEAYVNCRYPSEKIRSHHQYFALPDFYEMCTKDVFVDCGGFVGDTIEEYIFVHHGFGKIISFEPNISYYQAMQSRIERLNKEWALSPDKIQIVNAGVGNKTSAGTFINDYTISQQTNSSDDGIKIYALDDFFADQRIDFLKADIESFEWNMLHGAEKVIRRDLPKMAVCIYHSPSDIYRILLWLESLNLGYKFSVRHHAPKFSETVLYAYH